MVYYVRDYTQKDLLWFIDCTVKEGVDSEDVVIVYSSEKTTVVTIIKRRIEIPLTTRKTQSPTKGGSDTTSVDILRFLE